MQFEWRCECYVVDKNICERIQPLIWESGWICPILHFKAFSLKSLTRCERVNRYAYHKIDFTTIKLQIPYLQVMSLKPTWDFTILAFSKNEFYGQHEQILYIMKIQSFDQGDSASNSCRQSRVEIYMAQKRLGVEKKI